MLFGFGNLPLTDSGQHTIVCCSECGRQIDVSKEKIHKANDKILCVDCYKERREANSANAEKEKKYKSLFYNYLKAYCDIDEIPDWWVDQIDKLNQEDSAKYNYVNLYFVLKYVLSISDYTFNPKYGLKFLKLYFNESMEYYKKQKEVRAKNAQFEFKKDVNNITIVISNERPKPKTKIEEL